MTAFLIRLLLPSGADPGDPQVRQRCGSVSGGVGIALNALLFLGKLARRPGHRLHCHGGRCLQQPV